ncbi:MAG: methyltransferase domain-containing protein [Spirochaetales bacterium]|nr:methyltransferase domain-containing protein [Spirochaetales bacterium]
MNDKLSPMILCTPSILRGNGMGHLYRSAWIVEKMGERSKNTALYLPEAGKEGFFSKDEIFGALKGRAVLSQIIMDRIDSTDKIRMVDTLVLLDRRETSFEFLSTFSEGAVFIGIDEGGAVRNLMTYLADTLPALTPMSQANISSPLLLAGPVNRREVPDSVHRILVTFGGEDPGCLSESTIRMVQDTGKAFSACDNFDITLCLGPFALKKEAAIRNRFPDVAILRAPSDLKELLFHYDLIICSYGLTAFEAVRAGVPVILRNPSRYHDELSNRAGFKIMMPFGIGLSNEIEGFDSSSFLSLIKRPERINSAIFINTGEESALLPDLPEFLASHTFFNPICPSCGCKQEKSRLRSLEKLILLERFSDRTWYECRGCSMVFQNLHREQTEDYGEDYFFEGYRNQYGKTYLEDFPNLRRMAAGRLKVILKLASGADLLEIGCAYGPFLLEARNAGFKARGIDVTGDGVSYITDELELEALNISLEDFDLKADFGQERVDVLALWYVIEHFPELSKILSKLASFQGPGGILAFSTPNYRGISGRKNRRQFLSASPLDHYHVWSPGIARKVLKLYGYRVRRIRVTGHHPERFPLCRKREGVVFRIFKLISLLFGLGDTFEVYAEKITSPEEG